MADQPLQSLKSVYSFRHSISLFSAIEGVFSREQDNGTRTLQDLVKLLQPLKLASYRGTEMHDITRIGEGSSYRVYSCNHLKKQLVAAKIMKLPLQPSQEEKESFRRRVHCLIKDLEVMHHPPLASHENILRLLGYGWNLSEDSSLPFLVTEYADQGTLREFLRNKRINVASRLKLCGNIASGLHVMHLCGVSHGDLKLENVLVFREPNQLDSIVEQYSAKLSDFGNCCTISSEQAHGLTQSYKGTVGYIPPEIYQIKPSATDFRKCDIWALALAVWEILAGGTRYIEDPKVTSLLGREIPKASLTNQDQSDDDDTGREHGSRLGYGFSLISEHLCQLAVDFVEVEIKHEISPMSQALVKQIFRLSLQVDPIKRCGDVSKLPFTYSKHSSTTPPYPGAPSSYLDVPLMETTRAQANWSFEAFTPGQLRASKLPHTTKAQLVADARLLALTVSESMETRSNAALYVGTAYGIGFGVEENMEESLSWISRSADQGSPAASLILDLQENPKSRQEKILSAFKDSVEGKWSSSSQGTCRFARQNSEALDLSSFSSADNCNPLHYLSLFAMMTGPDSRLGRDGFDILKRTDINSQQLPKRNHWNKLKPPPLKTQELFLHEIVRHLGQNFMWTRTSKVHSLHAQFPMTLSGTPLSFAIILNCPEAIRALNHDVPWQKFVNDPIELEVAVACHRSDIFSLFWEDILTRGQIDQTINAFIYNGKGAHLIAALAQKSSLEQTILHGPNRSSAQSNIIRVLIASLSDLLDHRFYMRHKPRVAANLAIVKTVSEGVEQILELGALDIAVEVMAIRQTLPSRVVTPPLDKPYRQRIFEAAMHMACSGCFELGRSKKFLNFARTCGIDLNADFQAFKTMIEHDSDALFQSCMNDGMNVNSCDDKGQTILHYMIETGFHASIPITAAISWGMDPNKPTIKGQTPLHLAASLGLAPVVKDLIAGGAEPFAVDKDGTSVLLYAVTSGNGAVVAEILETLEAKLERSQRGTPSVQAFQTIPNILSNTANRSDLEYGTIDGCISKDGLTALQTAARNNHTEIVRLLLNYGARPDARDSDGNVALHHAVLGITNDANDASSCCQLLLEAQPRDLPRNKQGYTPLHLAAQRYSANSLIELLACFVSQQGCDINSQDRQGETILHQAAKKISLKSVQVVLEFGAAPNHKNAQGQTAMHLFVQAAYAVAEPSNWRHRRMQKMLEMLEMLLDAGADPHIRDSSQHNGGYTAMDYAAMNGNDAIFFHLYDECCQHPRGLAGSQYWLPSAWSLLVKEEQWHMVKRIMAFDSNFDPDRSLLEWPTGAHLLTFAIAVYDEDLLRRFSRHVISFRVSLEERQKLKDKGMRSNDDFKKIARVGAGLAWSSDHVVSWETSVDRSQVHRGGDPLREIFDFMTTLDPLTLGSYYANANRKRVLANEYGFRWENFVNAKTTPFHAALILLHGKTDS